MSEKDRILMNKMVEERVELKKKKDILSSELFELDRRIWMLIDIRSKEIDKKNKDG